MTQPNILFLLYFYKTIKLDLISYLIMMVIISVKDCIYTYQLDHIDNILLQNLIQYYHHSISIYNLISIYDNLLFSINFYIYNNYNSILYPNDSNRLLSQYQTLLTLSFLMSSKIIHPISQNISMSSIMESQSFLYNQMESIISFYLLYASYYHFICPHH